jgi:hemin uptake protein HemP
MMRNSGLACDPTQFGIVRGRFRTILRTTMSAAREKNDDQEDTSNMPTAASKANMRRVSVADLLAGDREIILEHGGAEYHLRVTSNGRLILTK